MQFFLWKVAVTSVIKIYTKICELWGGFPTGGGEGGLESIHGGSNGGLKTVVTNTFQGVFSKCLLMSASVSACNNLHTFILDPLEKSFSFLQFIVTQWLPFLYNLSHRLTELNVSLFYLMKLIFLKNI